MTKNDKALIAIARKIASLNPTIEEDIYKLRVCIIGLKELVAGIASPGDYVPMTPQDKAVIKAAFE